eukprot:s1182_g40.t1
MSEVSCVALPGETEVIQADSAKVLADRHQLFNVLLQDLPPKGGKASSSPVAPGHYLLRLAGEEVCGVEVLGTQPWQLVLGSAWAQAGHEASLAHLANVLRRRAGRWGCSLVYDTRDERGARATAKPRGSVPGARRSRPPGCVVRAAAAVRIQAFYRGRLGRQLAMRRRQRREQERLEEEQQKRAEQKKQQALEEAERQKKLQKEHLLKEFRERKCTLEEMCQGLPSHTRDWEEKPSMLLEMLDGKVGFGWEAWLGRHTDCKSARKAYLALARKWHPDKWTVQGERCVVIATEVAKQLVRAYEQLCINLPRAPADDAAGAEDDDENRECCEFASWVGVSFHGMEEIWKERRGVKR